MVYRVKKRENRILKLEKRRGVRKIKEKNPESVTGPARMKLATVVYGYAIIIIAWLFS